MPTYSYACTECGNRFDVVQAFTDDALTTCDKCSGRLRKLFSPVGVVFKGSGFYHNDSRESRKASTNGNGNNGQTKSAAETAGSTEKAGKAEKAGSTEKTATAKADTSSGGSTKAATGSS